MTINIFNIQHFSTGDGPGIRTTVFFEGCNLRCPWCHNPESFFYGNKPREIDDIVNEVMSDEEFYTQSGGGVTLSGGEPLFNETGCTELLRRLKEKGLNTIVDTALAVDGVNLTAIAAYTDTFFVDIKTADSDKFKAVCGGSLETLTGNIDKLYKLGADIVLRIPLIPDFNMDNDSTDGIITLVRHYNMPVTLLPFHRLGSAKYKQLGLEYKYAGIEPSPEDEIEKIRQKFISEGIQEANV
jgi:pyruvate formate lyase activating enzyme